MIYPNNDMKVVILAGGLGTRMGEFTDIVPKPMLTVGDKPLLWHIMKLYSYYGFKKFILCLGYKGNIIRDYFLNYREKNLDCTINIGTNDIKFYDKLDEDKWEVTVVDTGLNTQTGGRIKRIQHYIGNERFLLTYGDGLSNINIALLVKMHILNCHESDCIVTLSAVKSNPRFGDLELQCIDSGFALDRNRGKVCLFNEKTKFNWINGGFFVCEPEVFGYLDSDSCIFEKDVLTKLSCPPINQLGMIIHDGFWACCDTPKELMDLNKLWDSNNAQWKVW